MAPFRSERYAAWTDFRRQHLHWFSPAIAVDWLLAVAITWLAAKVERTYPYERAVEHYLGDVDLTWPHTWHERVPGPLLTRLAFWLPAALCAAVALVRVSLHELHHSLLVLYGSRAIMAMVVECLKNRVGRLRPDFLDRCSYSVIEKACTGPLELVKDGRRSFPSGHSATAFQGLFFLCLFIAGKNGAFAVGATFPRGSVLQSRMLRLTVAASPALLAGWICTTRIEDHMHHPTDVLAGATIGTLSALAVYLIYYPSPFNSADLVAMNKPRIVYGALDDVDERRIALGGEEAGEGFLRGGGAEEV